MRITLRQPQEHPWPLRGHHLRIMTFDDINANHGTVVDAAVDIGVNEIDVPEGHHVLRLFHTEGTWEEKQLLTSGNPVMEFDLPVPEYAFTRPEVVAPLLPITPAAAWTMLLSTHGGTIPDVGYDADPIAAAYATVYVAAQHDTETKTAFVVSATRDEAVLDGRVYPGDPDGSRQPRIRLRWDHPELGMVLPHLAMNQIGSAAPHVDRLVAGGTFGRLCRDGDVCGALAIAHVQLARRHELGEPRPMLVELAMAFPKLPDALLLLAYEELYAGDRERSVDLTLKAIAAGPPTFTHSVRTLQSLSFHHEEVDAIVKAGRLSGLVDPGCLFTSVRIPASTTLGG